MKRVGLLLTLVALMLSTPSVGAVDTIRQQKIVVSPGSTDVTLDPGGSIRKTITVVNKGEGPVTIAVSAVPYSVIGNDYRPVYTLTPGVVDASEWITFPSPATGIVLQSQAVHEIAYDVRIPLTMKAGGYTAAVLVTASPKTAEGSVMFHNRVSIPHYITVQGDIHASGNTEAGPLRRLLLGGGLHMPYTVTNSGKGYFIAKVRATVKTAWGRTVRELSDERYVLPATQRLIVLEWAPETVAGVYRVEQSAQYLGQVQGLGEHWVVVIRPEVLVGTAFVLIGGASWYVLARRHKR